MQPSTSRHHSRRSLLPRRSRSPERFPSRPSSPLRRDFSAPDTREGEGASAPLGQYDSRGGEGGNERVGEEDVEEGEEEPDDEMDVYDQIPRPPTSACTTLLLLFL